MNDTRVVARALALSSLLLVTSSLPGSSFAQSTATPATADAPALRALSLDAAVARALANNPGLRGAELDVAQAQQVVRAELGRYPYVYGADASYTRNTTARLGSGNSVISSTSNSYLVGSALRRTFPFGTTAEVRVQGERIALNAVDLNVASLRPGTSYAVTARAAVTQPLLRGFGRKVGELELRAARDNRVVSEKSKTRIKSELVRDTIIGYWELWYARAALEIEAGALKLAARQEADAKQQIAAGQLAEADVLTFSTRVAQLEEELALAEVTAHQRALELAQLMGEPSPAQELSAANEPPEPNPRSSRAEIEAALRSGSVELAELEAQARVLRTRAEVAGEQSRPALDADGYVESTGVSDGVSNAATRAGQLKWTSAHVGLTFELPLDDSRRRAERAGALLAVRIAEQNVKAARDRIAAEAALAAANEDAAFRRIILTQRTLDVAQKSFEAARGRFEVGEAIPIQVQQAEEDMRRARLNVARARVDLAQVQTTVQHLSGQLAARFDRKNAG